MAKRKDGDGSVRQLQSKYINESGQARQIKKGGNRAGGNQVLQTGIKR